jgi:hypothetical protein
MPDDSPLLFPQIPDRLERDLAIMKMGYRGTPCVALANPTQKDLARVALGIIFSTAVVTTLLAWWLLRP